MLIVARFVLQQAPLIFLQIPSFCSVEVIDPVWGTPSSLVYSLQISLRTPAVFLVSLRKTIFSTPTQAQFPQKFRLLSIFSFLSSRGALTLFSGQTRPFCMGTPGQRCSDASRLVLQGGILRWYYICTIITCRHVSLTHCACPLVESQVTHDYVNLGYSISHEHLVVGARLMNPIKIRGRITPNKREYHIRD